MENTVEWIKCLVSPRYAATTYLRITPEREKELLKMLTRIVIGIAVAAVLAGFFAAYRFGEYMQTKRLVNSQVYQIQIENSHTTPQGIPIYTN